MKTAIHFLSHLAHFLVRKMLQTKIVEKVKTQTLFSITSFRKSCRLCDNVEKYRTVEQATDDSTAHAHTVSEYFRYIDCLFLNTVSVRYTYIDCLFLNTVSERCTYIDFFLILCLNVIRTLTAFFSRPCLNVIRTLTVFFSILCLNVIRTLSFSQYCV